MAQESGPAHAYDSIPPITELCSSIIGSALRYSSHGGLPNLIPDFGNDHHHQSANFGQNSVQAGATSSHLQSVDRALPFFPGNSVAFPTFVSQSVTNEPDSTALQSVEADFHIACSQATEFFAFETLRHSYPACNLPITTSHEPDRGSWTYPQGYSDRSQASEPLDTVTESSDDNFTIQPPPPYPGLDRTAEDSDSDDDDSASDDSSMLYYCTYSDMQSANHPLHHMPRHDSMSFENGQIFRNSDSKSSDASKSRLNFARVLKRKNRRRLPTAAQRTAANIRERKRMYNLNHAFELLRDKVPKFAYEKHLSRIETLRLAMGYIDFMNDMLKKPPAEMAEKYGNAAYEMNVKWSAAV